jgi:MIP family channel proteins
VTVALAFQRQLSWRTAGWYILAQFLGAFLAAETVYLVYFEALNAFDEGARLVEGTTATAGIFATYPAPHLSTFPGGFLDQIVATALLVFCVQGIGDARNASWAKPIAPVLVGALVMVIGMAFGFNAGYAINPARDFAPRLFTATAGWGLEVFTAGNYWFWVPVVAPCLGGVLGAYLYSMVLGEEQEKLPAPLSVTEETFTSEVPQ